MARALKDTEKVLITFDGESLKKIDAYAETVGLTRAAAVRVLCHEALNQRKGMNALEELMEAYKAEQAKAAGQARS